MNRTPPVKTRRKLRREVNFGCAYPNCGNPYLEWHHFDPPWSEKHHHNPEGMIALCPKHHRKADVGAFTKEQLKEFKENARTRSTEVKGKFDWLRNKMVAVVGNVGYYETLTIFEYKNQPIIWFNRDENGYLQLNLIMLTKSGKQRVVIEDNFWINKGEPKDLISPPSGKKLKVEYGNGDFFKVEFHELLNRGDVKKKYPKQNPEYWDIDFPITSVEINYRVGGTDLEFGPSSTNLGFGTIRGFTKYGHCGISIG